MADPLNDRLERELFIAAVSARRLSRALAFAAGELRSLRESATAGYTERSDSDAEVKNQVGAAMAASAISPQSEFPFD